MTSKNSEKKILRKQKRCQQILSSELNIKFTDTPTKFLAVCNAGLSTALKYETLVEEVTKFGKLKQVDMIPGKSYCFIQFSEAADAILAFDEMHGKSGLGQAGAVLYLSYVESVPHYNNPWSGELPDGLVIIDDFITEAEEEQIAESIDWQDDEDGQSLKHRQVKHFGYEFIYGSNNVDINKPLQRKIPSSCDFLGERLKASCPGVGWHIPEQMTANKYLPGQGIPPHVDTHSAFEDPILSLSLLGNTVMEFRTAGKHSCVYLKRRSLLVMTGESRLGWTHGITPRMSDIIQSGEHGLTTVLRGIRVSLTFRKLKSSRCECRFPNLCDTFQSRTQMNLEKAAELELENVHKVYNQIGNHFSETRHSPWPQVEEFINSLRAGAILCDVGCGNGKYLRTNPEVLKIGCDRSESLLNVCAEREFNVFLSDCLQLPLLSNSVDACISIAVIHHLASKERRLRAIQEMARVLVSNGRALIYVWAKNQKADNKQSSYLRQNKKAAVAPENEISSVDSLDMSQANVTLPVHTNRTQFKHQDILVPWKLKSDVNENTDDEMKVYLRFYHVFEEQELENLCQEIDGIDVIKSYYDQGNWCVIFKKK